jgi:hypothetical protein
MDNRKKIKDVANLHKDDHPVDAFLEGHYYAQMRISLLFGELEKAMDSNLLWFVPKSQLKTIIEKYTKNTL